jgi:hypothetical protein
MIYFEPKSHTYRLDDPVNGELCISATAFLGLFKPKYDAEFWSYYTGLRYALGMEKKDFSQMMARKYGFDFKKVKLRTTEENKEHVSLAARLNDINEAELLFQQNIVKSEWKLKNDKSKTKGTAFHNLMEEEIHKDAGLEYEGVFARINKDTDDLSKLHDPSSVVIIPELKMYNRDFLISGMADKVFIHPNMKVDIDDWKTNEKIDRINPFGDKMLGPLSHYDDCNQNHYSLQVSLYAWMLEQYGYKPNNLKFTHVEIDVNYNILNRVEYRTLYLKRDVENMLQYYQDNKNEMLLNLRK